MEMHCLFTLQILLVISIFNRSLNWANSSVMQFDSLQVMSNVTFFSDEASPTIWSCYANIFVFKLKAVKTMNFERNELIMINYFQAGFVTDSFNVKYCFVYC